MSPEPWADMRGRIEAADLGVPISWPNEPFTQPDGAPGAYYLSVEAHGDLLAPIELGIGGWQEEGRIFIYISVAADSGTMDARVLAKRITNVFRFHGPNPTIYGAAAIGGGTPDDTEGLWWSMVVTIDYKYQDVPTF